MTGDVFLNRDITLTAWQGEIRAMINKMSRKAGKNARFITVGEILDALDEAGAKKEDFAGPADAGRRTGADAPPVVVAENVAP